MVPAGSPCTWWALPPWCGHCMATVWWATVLGPELQARAVGAAAYSQPLPRVPAVLRQGKQRAASTPQALSPSWGPPRPSTLSI